VRRQELSHSASGGLIVFIKPAVFGKNTTPIIFPKTWSSALFLLFPLAAELNHRELWMKAGPEDANVLCVLPYSAVEEYSKLQPHLPASFLLFVIEQTRSWFF
jgi:hypothetical protein